MAAFTVTASRKTRNGAVGQERKKAHNYNPGCFNKGPGRVQGAGFGWLQEIVSQAGGFG
jgi:hypothetical protein